jgi:hypothetical protein
VFLFVLCWNLCACVGRPSPARTVCECACVRMYVCACGAYLLEHLGAGLLADHLPRHRPAGRRRAHQHKHTSEIRYGRAQNYRRFCKLLPHVGGEGARPRDGIEQRERRARNVIRSGSRAAFHVSQRIWWFKEKKGWLALTGIVGLMLGGLHEHRDTTFCFTRARASTDWKSRTMVGKGCGPMAEPMM